MTPCASYILQILEAERKEVQALAERLAVRLRVLFWQTPDPAAQSCVYDNVYH